MIYESFRNIIKDYFNESITKTCLFILDYADRYAESILIDTSHQIIKLDYLIEDDVITFKINKYGFDIWFKEKQESRWYQHTDAYEMYVYDALSY